jgi:hypothetical protein
LDRNSTPKTILLSNFLLGGTSCFCELVFEDADDNWKQRSDNTGGSDIANLAERLQSAERSEQLTAAGAADISANGARNQTQKLSDYWACHGKSSLSELKLCGRPSSLLKENAG